MTKYLYRDKVHFLNPTTFLITVTFKVTIQQSTKFLFVLFFLLIPKCPSIGTRDFIGKREEEKRGECDVMVSSLTKPRRLLFFPVSLVDGVIYQRACKSVCSLVVGSLLASDWLSTKSWVTLGHEIHQRARKIVCISSWPIRG